MPDPKTPPEPDFDEMADRSLKAEIADEGAAYIKAMDRDAKPGDADRAPEGRSSEQPAEGGEEAAPRQEGSPG